DLKVCATVAQGFSPARSRPEGLRYEVIATLYRKFALKCASVRSQASLAAAASYRGVVSLLKPCCVPGYTWRWCFTLAALSAVSYAGQLALIRSSVSADWIKSGALIFGTSSRLGALPSKGPPAASSGTYVARRMTMPPPSQTTTT